MGPAGTPWRRQVSGIGTKAKPPLLSHGTPRASPCSAAILDTGFPAIVTTASFSESLSLEISSHCTRSQRKSNRREIPHSSARTFHLSGTTIAGASNANRTQPMSMSTGPRFWTKRTIQKKTAAAANTPTIVYQQHRRNSPAIRYSWLDVGRILGYSKRRVSSCQRTCHSPESQKCRRNSHICCGKNRASSRGGGRSFPEAPLEQGGLAPFP